jgi:DNA polymerase III subunit delta'
MTFADVVGQEAAKATLQRSLAAGRLPHALLMRGPAGVGKLPLALAIAQRVNCTAVTAEGDACNSCPSCHKLSQFIHPDLHLLVPYIKSAAAKGANALSGADDAVVAIRPMLAADSYLTLEQYAEGLGGENKQLVIPIDAVRELRRRLQLKNFEAATKVVIIWHAEKLNPEAANALLKVLEEPPDHTLFLLTLEEPSTLMPTLVSRCQGLRMGPLPRPVIEDWLVRTQGIDPARARAASAISEGSLPAAIGALSESEAVITEQLQAWLRQCYGGQFVALQQWAQEMAGQPKEQQKVFLHYALTQLRDALALVAGAPELVVAAEAERTFIENFSKNVSVDALDRMAHALEEGLHHLTRNANASLTLLDLSLSLHRALRAAA